MTESKIITAKGMCVIALTKYIMKKERLNREHAYYRLLESELYKLLDDAGTGLFLEPDSYLFEAYDIECKEGKEGLYGYIN